MFRQLFFISFTFFGFFISCENSNNINRGEVFRYNEASGVSSLDPAFSRDQASNWISKQIFSTLVDTDSSLQIVPNLSLSWNLSNDGLVYDFFLRSDVIFHNSPCFKNQKRYLTAHDVVYSLQRLKNVKTASPGAWVLENVKSISHDGPLHVVIILDASDPSFLGRLSMPYCGIVPEEAINFFGKEFSSNPIGTGPFYFKAWRRNDKLVLRRNKHFYQTDHEGIRLPYIEAVSIRFIPDRQAAFLEFIKGNLDFLTGVDPSYKDQLFNTNGNLLDQWRNKFKLYRSPFLNTEYIGIKCNNPSPAYLSDARVRRALNLAIDRENMIRYLKNGIGKAAYGGLIPVGLKGNRPDSSWKDPYFFNKQAAVKLLIDAGLIYDSVNPSNYVEPIILSTTSGYRDLCEYLQSAWGNIGIPVKVDVIPAASFREDKSKGRLSVYRASWIADYPDAENYLMLFEGKRAAPLGPNSSQFVNSKFDSLLSAGRNAILESSRINAYERADKLLHDQSRLIPLIYDESVRVIEKKWIGLPAHPMNWLDLRHIKKAEN